MTWYRFTGHVGTVGWTNPGYAHDVDSYPIPVTRATATVAGGDGSNPTGWLYLTCAPVTPTRVRYFLSWSGTLTARVTVEAELDAAWQTVQSGGTASKGWHTHAISGQLTRIRIRFWKGYYGSGYNCEVGDAQYEIPATTTSTSTTTTSTLTSTSTTTTFRRAETYFFLA